LHPRQFASKTMLPKGLKSRILATQFEPVKTVVEVAPLRRKSVVSYCRKLTASDSAVLNRFISS
ncbi:MAG: hypothetical protein ACXW3B_20080, partial [Telluria sp.]